MKAIREDIHQAPEGRDRRRRRQLGEELGNLKEQMDETMLSQHDEERRGGGAVGARATSLGEGTGPRLGISNRSISKSRGDGYFHGGYRCMGLEFYIITSMCNHGHGWQRRTKSEIVVGLSLGVLSDDVCWG